MPVHINTPQITRLSFVFCSNTICISAQSEAHDDDDGPNAKPLRHDNLMGSTIVFSMLSSRERKREDEEEKKLRELRARQATSLPFHLDQVSLQLYGYDLILLFWRAERLLHFSIGFDDCLANGCRPFAARPNGASNMSRRREVSVRTKIDKCFECENMTKT